MPEDNPREPGISPMLAELRDLLGRQLDPARTEAILAYLSVPSLGHWRGIRQVIIKPGTIRRATLWQWVVAVDPWFPLTDDGGALAPFPDPFTVARAIQAAADAG